jgi:hypothetical protein
MNLAVSFLQVCVGGDSLCQCFATNDTMAMVCTSFRKYLFGDQRCHQQAIGATGWMYSLMYVSDRASTTRFNGLTD